jgi:hypothetical protein
VSPTRCDKSIKRARVIEILCFFLNSPLSAGKIKMRAEKFSHFFSFALARMEFIGGGGRNEFAQLGFGARVSLTPLNQHICIVCS